LPSLFGQSEIKGISNKDPSDEFGKTSPGSNFLGLTAERLLDSRVDARTMPEAACPLTLADQNSRKLTATTNKSFRITEEKWHWLKFSEPDCKEITCQ
jgi:hypothetical protein